MGDLFYTKIGDTGVSIGTYPLTTSDCDRIMSMGVTGVLNLMTHNDYRQRGLPWQKLHDHFKSRGIKCSRFPINDMTEKELQSNLFIAAQHLNNMINVEGLNVYVHCTSGVSRAPAVVVTYLCLFKQVKCWNSVEDTSQFIKAYNPKLAPNNKIIQKCI